MQSNDSSGDHGAFAPAPRERLVDPTAPPIYGNFQRYYHIRNPINATAAGDASHDQEASSHPALAVDSRVTAILRYLRQHFACSASSDTTAGLWPPSSIKVLDIGCNSGKVTIELMQTLPRLFKHGGQPVTQTQLCILGVDIDASLISQARQAAGVARSRYQPEHLEGSDTELEDDSLPYEAVYFPSVFPSLYGLTAPEGEGPRHGKRRRTEDAIDNNTPVSMHPRPPAAHLSPPYLHFVAADWVQPSSNTDSMLNSSDSHGYDMILALSITKWIHIQQGDAGLVRFFARISHTLHPGGLLFLERQEWSSYHSAKNLDPSIRGKIKRLQLRPGGDFDWWLETFGLRLVAEIGLGVGVGFERPLQVFRKELKASEAERLAERTALEGMPPVPWTARSSTAATSRAATAPGRE
ncbi:hypothetical protein EX895_001019 [Sporisorium graminicola]|uniref:RNA methyltransferase n=1 Tax=Sporisorium graminicola TaxID=280036 RepID=A0A4U7L2J0_9BASI|nr:hypothetical protein EX895_001019 [Sporisorium graminicola]TKY91020.1 hypothetical protein EX895_001019 [Sporisorium graminicola]